MDEMAAEIRELKTVIQVQGEMIRRILDALEGKGKQRAVAADKEKGKKPAVAAKSEKEKKEASTGAKASRSTGKRKEEKVVEGQDEEEVSVI